MRKYLLYLFILAPLCIQADLLSDICDKKYEPQTFSAEQMDSILNANEGRYRLAYENKRTLYRHSFEANYFLIDTKNKNARIPLCEEPIREVTMSPNGKYIAYAKGNNLFIYKVDFRAEVQITKDDAPQIYNGCSDWLYEEEFGTTGQITFSPDSKFIVYVQLDATAVQSYSFLSYLHEQDTLWSRRDFPIAQQVVYPRVGKENPHANVLVYDIQYKSIQPMQIGDLREGYVPRLAWWITNAPKKGKADDALEYSLAILKMNRDQNRFEVLTGNIKSGVCRQWYLEENKNGWVDYSQFDDWQWLRDGRVVVANEKSGWKQAYLYNSNGQELQQLTQDGTDIVRIYGFDEQKQTLYYLSADTPLERYAYALNINKKTTTRLTKTPGWHTLTFSKDLQKYIDCYQSDTQPNTYTLHDVKTGKESVLQDNAAVAAAWKHLTLPQKEFFKIKCGDDDFNGWILAPSRLTKKAPCVLIQYGGPASQLVTNRWRRGWEYALVAEGYVVACVDGKGTYGRGRTWREASYMQLGVQETSDQLSVARTLPSLFDFIDETRLCVWGWSYGGYMALRLLCAPQSPFKCGIAVAPVTDWELYDSGYTERYMRRVGVNGKGYKNASILPRVKDLQGRLLLVHGLADDNVHVQNSWLLVEELVKNGKQFEMQLYPDDNHFLKKRKNAEHVHRRFLDFINRNL